MLKGVKTILEERGLWVPGTKLEAARELLASQPDFAGEREWMTAVVEDSGHVIDFYPKFHCELNFIERLWAAAKRWTRANCDYTFNSLIAKVPIALEQIPQDSIRRYARGAWRYMTVYCQFRGTLLSARQALWAHKKYSSHRTVPEGILDQLERAGIV